MVNSVKLKIFSIWPKIKPKTAEIIFSPYFHFKHFPPLSHTHSSLTHALPLSKLDCSDPQTEPNGTIHTDAPRSRSRRSPELHRSTSITIAIAPIDVDHDRDRADRRRSRSSKSARLRSRSHRSRAKRRLRSRSRSRDRDRGDCDRDLAEKHFSFLGFICVFRNEWHYVFVW